MTDLYFKKRYESDKEFKDKIKVNVIKYQKTENGKTIIKKCRKNFKKIHPNYQSEYMKKRREEARNKKICIICFKNPIENNLFCCKSCLDKQKQRKKEKDMKIKKK